MTQEFHNFNMWWVLPLFLWCLFCFLYVGLHMARIYLPWAVYNCQRSLSAFFSHLFGTNEIRSTPGAAGGLAGEEWKFHSSSRWHTLPDESYSCLLQRRMESQLKSVNCWKAPQSKILSRAPFYMGSGSLNCWKFILSAHSISSLSTESWSWKLNPKTLALIVDPIVNSTFSRVILPRNIDILITSLLTEKFCMIQLIWHGCFGLADTWPIELVVEESVLTWRGVRMIVH